MQQNGGAFNEGSRCIRRPQSGSLTKRRGSHKTRSLRSTHLALLSRTYLMANAKAEDDANMSRGSTPTPPLGIIIGF